MSYSRDLPKEMVEAIKSYGLARLADGVANKCVASELHHRVYNEDYFIIGIWQAKQFLGEHTFTAIEIIREYENDNFGESYTKIEPENVVNMLAYIIGEEFLSNSTTLQEKWDRKLTKSDIKAIIQELSDDE